MNVRGFSRFRAVFSALSLVALVSCLAFPISGGRAQTETPAPFLPSAIKGQASRFLRGNFADLPTLMVGQPALTYDNGVWIGTPTGNQPIGIRWFAAPGAPLSTLGNSGDFYLDGASGAFYQKSTGAAWTTKGCLMGPVGPAGPVGPQGLQGVPGVPGASIVGATGAAGKDGRDGQNALPLFRTARIMLPAITIGVGVSINVPWSYQGTNNPFPDAAYTVGAPALVGPASLNLSFRVIATSPTGCTVFVSAGATVAANTARLDLIAIHD